MTARRREVLTFISGYIARHDVPPSMREIADGIGVVSPSTAWSHVEALVRDGHLERREVYGATRYFPVGRDVAA